MADVRRLYTEQMDAARQTLSRGDRDAAAVAFHAAIDAARGDSALEPELVPALVHLGKLEQELGRSSDAERALTDALEIGERHFGADHPSLGAVLNELSRLYIRQSQHARAELVLERLLRIMRTKGDQHPDVATALAGTALVKRALGDHAAAEERFRDALRIRESALAPEHMATVVTMEQLSETCATRGNFSEALALLQRALPTREAALGTDHATVRALRTRIAALELRVLETTLPSAEDEIISATHADELADPLLPVWSPSRAAANAEPPSASESAAVAELAPFPTETTRRPRRKRVALFASAAVAALALATLVPVAYSRADLGSDHVSENSGAESRGTGDMSRRAHGAATPSAAAATPLPDNGQRPAVESSTGIVQAGAPMPESAALPSAPKLPGVPKSLAAVTAKLMLKTNVDSLVRASTKLDRDVASDQIGTSGGVLASPHVDDASMRPARLIAPAPLPHFPDELRNHWNESEVVVRFRVDERGHVDVKSMKVLKSEHELFAAAVRNVLPRFRFEPARSPAPQSKPISDWVDFRVQFAAE